MERADGRSPNSNGNLSGPTPKVTAKQATGRGVKDAGHGSTPSLTMKEQGNKGSSPRDAMGSLRGMARKVSENSGGSGGMPEDVRRSKLGDSTDGEED